MELHTEGREGSPATRFGHPATPTQLERVRKALEARGFVAEVVADAQAARERVRELIPEGSSVFTTASETLRLSGIDDDLNTSGMYEAVRSKARAMNRGTEGDAIRRLTATPDIVVGSVSAVTEDGSLIAVSATGSQIPAYGGGAGRAIILIGAQKIVPDVAAGLRRVEEYALPLESERTIRVYGQPSAVKKILIVSGEGFWPRITVLLIGEAIGF